ncbi:hypothetical protein D3C87_1473120 [compost metagenome]
MHERLDHSAQIVAIDLGIVTNGVDAGQCRLLHCQHQLRKRVRACASVIEADVLGRIPVAVIVKETGLFGQPVFCGIHRHTLQRRQDTGVKGTVDAILIGKVRRQCLFRFLGAPLRHHPLAQLRGVGEVMQR